VSFPFFDASLRCLLFASILGLMFLGENLVPLGREGDGSTLLLERRHFRTMIIDDSLIYIFGGFSVLVVRAWEDNLLLIPMKIMGWSSNTLFFS
jgi:hypothetical protein